MLRIKSPLMVYLEVTHSCDKQLRDDKSKLDKYPIINKESLSYSVNQIIENEVFKVVITGGEPLSVFDELLPYLEKLREHNISISLYSNLMLFNQKIADELLKLNIKNLLVPFPASNARLNKRITGNRKQFSKTIEGIKLAKKNGFEVTTNMVVSQTNYEDIYNTARLAKDIGADVFSVNTTVPLINYEDPSKIIISKEQLKTLPFILKKIKKEVDIKIESNEAYPRCMIYEEEVMDEIGFNKTCGAGETFCVISPDGDIRPCMAMSNTYGKDFKDAWNRMMPYRDGDLVPKICKNCRRLHKCHAGCKLKIMYNNYICDPYMNENVKYTYDRPKLDFELLHLFDDSLLIISSDIKFRTEIFGGTIMSSTHKFAHLKMFLFSYLTSNKGKIISFYDFYNSIRSSKVDALKTVSYLFDKDIITYADGIEKTQESESIDYEKNAMNKQKFSNNSQLSMTKKEIEELMKKIERELDRINQEERLNNDKIKQLTTYKDSTFLILFGEYDPNVVIKEIKDIVFNDLCDIKKVFNKYVRIKKPVKIRFSTRIEAENLAIKLRTIKGLRTIVMNDVDDDCNYDFDGCFDCNKTNFPYKYRLEIYDCNFDNEDKIIDYLHTQKDSDNNVDFLISSDYDAINIYCMNEQQCNKYVEEFSKIENNLEYDITKL